jgi:hypothetical protein
MHQYGCIDNTWIIQLLPSHLTVRTWHRALFGGGFDKTTDVGFQK